MLMKCLVVSKMVPNITNVLKTISVKHLVRRVFILCCSLFASALLFNFFQRSSHLVTGGTSGVAIITEYLFGWDPSLVILVISCVFLVLSLFLLGWEATGGALIATFVYPYFVNITSHWPDVVFVDTTDMLLVSIIIGVVAGITNGLTYKNGFNNGGFSILSQILYKYQRISISTSSFIINMIIVLSGGFLFGWNMVMYAAIILYINSIVTDRVLIGISKNKSVFMMTSKEKEVKDYIMNTLKHGTTELEAEGGYRFQKKKLLMTVIPSKDYFKLKEGVRMIDKDVFFIVTDSYQVSGGK